MGPRAVGPRGGCVGRGCSSGAVDVWLSRFGGGGGEEGGGGGAELLPWLISSFWMR